MDLFDLRKEPHLSASQIDTYSQCGLLFKFAYIDRLQPEFRSDNLELGTCIHLALADFHKQKITGRIMSAKELQETFKKYWKAAAEGYEGIQYSEGKDYETLLMEGQEMLTAYYHKVPHDQFKVVAIEQPFRFLIDGCPPVIGAFDLIEEDEAGTIIIVDWKTSARGYGVREIDKNLQLSIYQLALLEDGCADHEILLRLDVLVKTKQKKLEQYYSSRSKTDLKRTKKIILETWKGITSNVFIPYDSPSNFRCPNCSYKKSCDEWFAR